MLSVKPGTCFKAFLLKIFLFLLRLQLSIINNIIYISSLKFKNTSIILTIRFLLLVKLFKTGPSVHVGTTHFKYLHLPRE